MVLYNLTPNRELTQPGCESSPWIDSDQHAAYIPSRVWASAVLPYVLLVLILPTVSQSPCLWSHTLVRMCICISTWIYVHLTAHVCFYPMHSLMERWVPLYVSMFVSQSSHFCSTLCLECVHTSVHEFMSIWLPISAPQPVNSLMETWGVCWSPSPYFLSHTLVRMCTCISTSIYVHLTVPVCSTPMHSLVETWVLLYGSVFVSQSPHLHSHTLFRMCTCISTCVYVHMTPHVS